MIEGNGRVLSTPELARSLSMPLYWAGYDMLVCRFDRRALPEAVKRAAPDILLVNALMAGLDTALLAEQIAALPLDVLPAIVALFPAESEEAMRASAERGVVCVPDRCRAPDQLVPILTELTLEDRLAPSWADGERVAARLRLLGVKDRTVGFEYLKRCIMLCARDCRCFGRLATQIYPRVAHACGTSAAAVERLARHAIESAWLHGDIETQYTFFGNTVDESKGKPTNSEFIARITEALRLEAKT